jgi:hypothetical protein
VRAELSGTFGIETAAKMPRSPIGQLPPFVTVSFRVGWAKLRDEPRSASSKMNPVLTTVAMLLGRYTAEAFIWFEFALLPLLVPAVISIAMRSALAGRGLYVLPTAARIIGYPALATMLIFLPWAAFQIYLVPVILDAHPGTRPFMAVPLAIADWLVRYAFLLGPFLWPLWVVLAAIWAARQKIQRLPPD